MATGARRAAVALGLALVVALPACSWGAEEPGLFSTPVPTPTSPSTGPTVDPTPVAAPEATDPRLPVVGEAVWTTADGLDVTVRFAVHAVRRTGTATVLDWSVTPLVGPGARAGEPLPSGTDLALDRSLPGQQDLALLDPGAERVYRPLAGVSPDRPSRCLCTPLIAVLPRLRFGETRLLQLAFPVLPAATTRVDVALPNLAVVPGVPVTPVGQAPVARTPTDLTRPAPERTAATGARLHALTGTTGDLQSVVVDRVVASGGLTSVEWTLTSVDDQDTRTRAVAPLSRPTPGGVRVTTAIPASGPRLEVRGRPPTSTGVLWTTTRVAGRTAYECLCSGLGLWSRGLREAGGSARLTTQVGPLPAGTERVDVALPDLEPFTDVPVERVADAAVLPTVDGPAATWTYDPSTPPSGWTTSAWPTPLPAEVQGGGFASEPGRVVAALPRS
ncbi:hypothetical protein SAMN04488544_0114 [Microlunatus sagamiharensis]|uniref:Uncharacterized protein n=1 Tax=Microlunatus sagamiharensis TaxID=546874 RepID=A0A1H2LGF3_9ACTN|nr:hypothetical protein [Microlunatus sagamiharensis]SDU80097.1 hypothetical protein SAMN04488544_0114 [Microlunatus sagamiharensis]